MRDRLLRARIAAGRKSVLLLGPRQVGKSTLCRSLDPDFYVDLADEAEYLSYAKDPARLRRELAAGPPRRLVVVDEVQRLPSLLNTIQSLIDRSPAPRFILTGSSARKRRDQARPAGGARGYARPAVAARGGRRPQAGATVDPLSRRSTPALRQRRRGLARARRPARPDRILTRGRASAGAVRYPRSSFARRERRRALRNWRRPRWSRVRRS
ncbi:AAA family ATPase [bacterium]|nr:AAA family ATPase [bacterium]